MAVNDRVRPHTIRSVEAKIGHKLSVTWERGPQATIDFSETIAAGGIFESLKDEAAFAKVQLHDDRDKIVWPEPVSSFGDPLIDIDSESLFEMATEQRSTSLLHRMLSLLHSADKAKAKRLLDAQ